MKLLSLSLVSLAVLASSCANTDVSKRKLESAAAPMAVSVIGAATNTYVEQDGLVVIEAEKFASQTLADTRRWLVFDENGMASEPGIYADPDTPHSSGASGNRYIEILPDNRTNHDEKLIQGENFMPTAGNMAVLTYPVYFTQPGRYFIWGRAFSTGSEDNGFHFGLDGVWQESSQRLQFCEGKHEWTWSSQQRRPENHCGTPGTLWIDVAEAGQHMLMLSMREDGAELDKIILAKDEGYVPQGLGPDETLYTPAKLVNKTKYLNIVSYTYLLNSAEHFEYKDLGEETYYYDKWRDVLGINAGNAALRNKFISAKYTIKKGKDKAFNLKLVTLTELDGESEYRVLVNDKLIAEVKNPETTVDYKEAVFDLGKIKFEQGDVITVQSNAVTNGKIPEGDITAFSRGRWQSLVLQKR